MRDDITYQEIVSLLNNMAETIAADCIPDGKRDGKYWRGDLHGKISVHITGSRVGTVGGWQGQFGSKTGGNLISLIELAMGFSSHGEAVRYAKTHYLNIGKRELTVEERRAWAKSQEESKRKAEERQRKEEADKERKVETVRSIWSEAVPIAGTLAEEYLRSRSIELSDLGDGAVWPASLRFHPGVMHGNGKHPALIGGVQAKDRKLIAIWRIFLQPDGKALLDEDGKKIKLGFGPAAGGAVRLGPVTPTLRLTEGIETALGTMCLSKSKSSVWATLSTSGMIGFQIPEGVKRLEIYADGDRHRLNKRTGSVDDPPGIKAAKQLRDRAINEGVEVVVRPSPEPDDWLDVYQSLKRDRVNARLVQFGE